MDPLGLLTDSKEDGQLFRLPSVLPRRPPFALLPAELLVCLGMPNNTIAVISGRLRDVFALSDGVQTMTYFEQLLLIKDP